MQSYRRRLRFGAALAVAFAALTNAAAASPQRIVSLNLCADELLLRLVPHERIASVTWLARDAGASNVSTEAQGVTINHGSAEEVIPSAPDLVLAGQYTTVAATSLLRRTGFRVATLAIPNSFEDVHRQIEDFGRLVGVEGAAEKLNDDIASKVDAASGPPNLRRPRALVFNPNGVTVGQGTLANAIMTKAGLDNIAARLTLGGYHQVPLEQLIGLNVEVLIITGATRGTPSLATDVLRHPVLRELGARMVVVELPGRLWGCAGPGLIEAVDRLRAAADEARGRAGVQR